MTIRQYLMLRCNRYAFRARVFLIVSGIMVVAAPRVFAIRFALGVVIIAAASPWVALDSV